MNFLNEHTMLIALGIFVLMYVFMLIFSKKRMFVALGAAALMVILQVLPLADVLPNINWNVIMMISGTMGIVALFIDSKMPSRLADLMLTKVPNACWAIVVLSIFSGLISAFVDNVATVLMLAPVGLAVCKKIKSNPVPAIIAIAVSSNLQGAATLVGDTTSILLGGYAKMSFVDFIFWQGKPSIFWAVELGALGTVFILFSIFRKDKQKITPDSITEVNDYVPAFALVFTVVALIVASFFEIPYIDDIKNGLICLTICVLLIIRTCIKQKGAKPIKAVAEQFDYETVLTLCGLFVVVASITKAGIIDVIANWFAGIGDGNVFLLYTIIVFASVALSAFIDNIPYVAAMLPVVEVLSQKLGISPVVLYFGLLSGATLGGNITPFGASANVTAIGILKKNGYSVKNSDFFKIGIPFTLTAVLIGYVFIWFVWA